MDERREQLQDLAADIEENGAVRSAWLAKSFTDRLFVVEVPPETDLPTSVEERLHEADLRGVDEVYDADAGDAAYAGHLEDGDRYRFVDCRSRGELQSYVVD